MEELIQGWQKDSCASLDTTYNHWTLWHIQGRYQHFKELLGALSNIEGVGRRRLEIDIQNIV